MGVVYFFSWLRKNFGNHIYKLNKEQNFDNINVDIDNLLIDMNGIFHNSAQKIYKYGSYKPQTRLLGKPQKPVSGLSAQIALFQDVCKVFENILDIVKPNKRLVLCIDGPAPLGKQNQQRQRRFRSSKEAGDDNLVFNSNCITPGTKFMDYLSKYIDWYIRKRINEDQKWQNIEVIFSNEKAQGEGEHKLINYIRFYGDLSDTYCIHGMDADLIMLALGTHIENFYILREDMYDPVNEFFCIDIGNMHSEISDYMIWDNSDGEECSKFNEISSINDFIFMCFMAGNDFLPHMPSIEIVQGGIEILINIYKSVCKSYGHLTEVVNGNLIFRHECLCSFLGSIGNDEKFNFETKLESREFFFDDKILSNSSTQHDEKWDVDIDNYRKEYTKQCFPCDISIEKICHDYLEGLQWVLSYYTKGVPNWKWYFPYHYAPMASSLAKYVKTFEFKNYGRTLPSTPFQQLLCVFPPKSSDLLPEPLNKLLTDSKSPIKKFCPDDFRIDLSGKRKEWEGIVILPMVDFELVRTCYLENIDKVDEKDLKRNLLGRTFLYKYSKKYPSFIFKSYYGNIENCYVKNICIDL